MIKFIKKYIAKKENKKLEKTYAQKYGFICYCNKCKNILNDSPIKKVDKVVLEYTCKHCGKKSRFFFGVPVPILLED